MALTKKSEEYLNESYDYEKDRATREKSQRNHRQPLEAKDLKFRSFKSLAAAFDRADKAVMRHERELSKAKYQREQLALAMNDKIKDAITAATNY